MTVTKKMEESFEERMRRKLDEEERDRREQEERDIAAYLKRTGRKEMKP